MSEPIVRVAQGFFEPELFPEVEAKLHQGRAALEPALRALSGLRHYYVSIDLLSHSMVNVSVWDSVEAAEQMNILREMLAQRSAFEKMGVVFQPIRNYEGLWSVEP